MLQFVTIAGWPRWAAAHILSPHNMTDPRPGLSIRSGGPTALHRSYLLHWGQTLGANAAPGLD